MSGTNECIAPSRSSLPPTRKLHVEYSKSSSPIAAGSSKRNPVKFSAQDPSRPRSNRLSNVLRLAKYDCKDVISLVGDGRGPATIVEVGAYNGVRTKDYASVSRVVYSFEATPSKVATIESNIEGEFRDRVKFYNVAVGDYTGKAKLFLPSGDGAQQDSLGNQSFWAGNDRSIEVDIVQLDDIVKEHVDLLQIDVQGHEMQVLRGAEGLIRDHGVDIIHVEFTPNLLKASETDPVDFLYYLTNLGYFCMDCDVFLPPSPSEARTFEEYAVAFKPFFFQNGDHGGWTDLLCYSLH